MVTQNSKLNITTNFIYRTVEEINKEKKYCIIMGDFNIDLLSFDSHKDTEDFVNTLASYFFHPQILKPTRFTNHSATLIDNIFFNSLEHQTISGNIIYDISDHLPNFLIINKLSSFPKKTKMYKRDYSKFDKTALIYELSDINWTDVLYNDNISNNSNTLFQNFYNHITLCIDKHVPLRKLTRKEIKSVSKPWITPGIIESSKIKNNLYKKYLSTKDVYFLTNISSIVIRFPVYLELVNSNIIKSISLRITKTLRIFGLE